MDSGRGFPPVSESVTTSKSRFGFQDHHSNFVLPVRATPILHKSASVENMAQFSAIRSISRRFDEDEVRGCDGSVCQSFDISEDPTFWKDNNVQVVIRLRPLSSTEISLQGHNKCIKQENSQTILWTGHPESRFTFDLVADENVSQEKLFKVAGLSMVENCIGGYNSCMFAYGQTGSGKTHTMLGDIEGGTRRHSINCGITPRVFDNLFSRIQKEKEARKDEKLMFTCKCSFLEIYNEQILDLLDPSSSNLQIREDIKKGVYVENLREVEVMSAREVIQHLIQGAANRKVASTNMNHASSRSHSVFTCIIESQWESQGVTHHRFARLNLVDLAGSERQKSSGAEGERLKEATNINKSLSTLGLVIMNLVSISNGKAPHVPYRDSKLTFLLQDSLGGNSKTIIIANISPASCCSLETLSTLKFAQRAKFIRNNAIVNEDASGDVIAMRLQIQQLKKEIARLRGYVGGADNQDIDMSTVSFPGSPGSFKWEGLGGLCSPLTTGKGKSQKREYEVTLVGAFKREKDKDLALQALAAENQAAMQLAKQREDEIQGLKMRLRFREAGIKRMESLVSGKISAETHLMKEKDEILKEIEVLKTQVDRNQEVTRFAMENLRLKEEIRRLKSFYEEGERELMDEQIKVLQNKLLEALDWKLMYETDSLTTQIENSSMLAEVCKDDNLLISNQDPRSPRQSFINEENEFLRMQAIENQAELDSLCKKLELCLEEKERLESHVNDLISKLEAEKSYRESEANQIQLLSSDQMELKTMVDAIAAASQREAEAHEKAIRISNENDELRMKVNILIEDNTNLIEMYEKASSEFNKSETSQCTEMQKVIQNLEDQLVEMHEENDKLMGLYEEAMREKDELKKMVSTFENREAESSEDLDCLEKLALVDEGMHLEKNEGISQICIQESKDSVLEDSIEEAMEGPEPMEEPVEILNMVKSKLEKAEDQLSDTAITLASFSSLERLVFEADNLSREIEFLENEFQVKQNQLESNEELSSGIQERRTLVLNKLSALKFSMSSLSSSLDYFEEREARARVRRKASKFYLDQKKREMGSLQILKNEMESAKRKIQNSENELRTKMVSLKSKLDEENQKQENEKVLFAIENNIEPTYKSLNLSGKATELLKSEEEKTKLQAQMKLSREKLVERKRELEETVNKSAKLETELIKVESEVEKAADSVLEMELKFKTAVEEKQTLLETIEMEKTETGKMILDYQEWIYRGELNEAEKREVEEELEMEFRTIQEKLISRTLLQDKAIQLLRGSNSCLKMEEEVQNLVSLIVEARLLLEKR